MTSTPTAQGQCLCGSVAFTAQQPSLWVVHCHCTRCQRAHGAAFVTWVGFLQQQVQIHDSKQQLKWFRTTTPHTQNSAQNNTQTETQTETHISERGFCAQCGSPMFFKSTACANEIHIARALFTTPLTAQPDAHVHYDTQVDWVHIAERLRVE